MTYRLFCRTLTFVFIAMVFSGPASLAAAEEEKSAQQVIRDRISERVPGLTITGVRPSPAAGLYEVVTSTGETIYATETGEYLLTGDMLQLTDTGIANVSEAGRAERRTEVLKAFGDEGLITYPAKGQQKAEVAVFTDIDCPYCRKLHDEMERMNAHGITVHYYGFPRSGPSTPSFRKYESVWCADDQQSAMDAAKQGRNVESRSCENPVGEQFQLGGEVGVTGTPAIVLEDGSMVRGYVPADELARRLGLL